MLFLKSKKSFALICMAGILALNAECKPKDNGDDGLLLAGLALIILATPKAPNPADWVGTWGAPASGSTASGACIWLDNTIDGLDYCQTNYLEGACASLPSSSAGGTTYWSTSAKSTSINLTDNLCTDNGFTNCTNPGGFVSCGPNNFALPPLNGRETNSGNNDVLNQIKNAYNN